MRDDLGAWGCLTPIVVLVLVAAAVYGVRVGLALPLP